MDRCDTVLGTKQTCFSHLVQPFKEQERSNYSRTNQIPLMASPFLKVDKILGESHDNIYKQEERTNKMKLLKLMEIFIIRKG